MALCNTAAGLNRATATAMQLPTINSAASISYLSQSAVASSVISLMKSSKSTFHSHCWSAVRAVSSSPLQTLSSSSSSACAPLSSSSSSSSICSSSSLLSHPFPPSVCLRRGVRVMTYVQYDEEMEKQAAAKRAAEKEKIIDRAHLNVDLLPDAQLSTRDILTKNLLHVPPMGAPYNEVFGDFKPTLAKPAPWIRSEEELQKIQPIALPWKETSIRSGVIGRKMGMMHVWDHWGRAWPLTCIKIDSVVVHVCPEIHPKSGLVAMQLGSGYRPTKRTNKPMLGHYKKSGLAPCRRIRQMLVTPDAVLPVGYLLTARHFVPGQYVDIQGVSIGKGFQGGMKRWNFHGMPASHGVSKVHRHIGSVGNMGVAKIYKGKKMPGRLGGQNSTSMNRIVYKVDVLRNLVYVVGPIPGFDTNFVTIRDAVKKKFHPSNPPPFPTYVPQPNEEKVKEIVMPAPLQDPEADI